MKNLLVCGDSWTFGSEIRNPILPEHIKDWDTLIIPSLHSEYGYTDSSH